MKSIKNRVLIAFLASLLLVHGQESYAQNSELNDFLTLRVKPFLLDESSASINSIVNGLQSHIQQLEKFKSKREKRGDAEFLHAVFFKTHRKFLKKYDPTVGLEEMLSGGKYGCLSGTALYSLILEYFGYDHNIVELADHVYLKVNSKGQHYTFESTDPSLGLIRNDISITQLKEQFGLSARKTNSLLNIGGIASERNRGYINANLSIRQLAGLQFYNLSIRHYVNGEYTQSLEMISKAVKMYRSDRTEDMMQFVISTILRNKKISGVEKQKYLRQYVSQVQKKRLSQTL